MPRLIVLVISATLSFAIMAPSPALAANSPTCGEYVVIAHSPINTLVNGVVRRVGTLYAEHESYHDDAFHDGECQYIEMDLTYLPSNGTYTISTGFAGSPPFEQVTGSFSSRNKVFTTKILRGQFNEGNPSLQLTATVSGQYVKTSTHPVAKTAKQKSAAKKKYSKELKKVKKLENKKKRAKAIATAKKKYKKAVASTTVTQTTKTPWSGHTFIRNPNVS